ncbi:Transcription termination factor MTERF4 chloroplastic [Bienertia sinuspersici]
MLRIRSICNGAKDFNFIIGFRQLVLYSTSISIEGNPNFVNYLVENLGFSRQQALSTSTKFTRDRLHRGAKKVSDFNFVGNVDSVITFLNKIGLQQNHIRNAIDFEPRVLVSNVDKTLMPKIEGLEKLGFSRSDIADVFSVNPSIFMLAFNTTIIPAIQALREIMDCEGHVISLLKKTRHKKLTTISRFLVPNVALLRSYGIPNGSIRKFILKNPYSFLIKTDSFQNAVIRVEEKLGIPRTSPQFLAGIALVTTSTEKGIESKKQVYKSFGWTDSDIATLVLLNPVLLALSEDSIKKKLDFVMNEVGCKASYLAPRCYVLTYSLEKRVVPRHKTVLFLKENGLITENYSLGTVVTLPHSKFLKKFVLPFKEVHEFYSKHAGISLRKITQL